MTRAQTQEKALPPSQHAVLLTGPDTLVLERAKSVTAPGPRQILARVEAVGLCFSDLKLLKQFRDHARKSDVTSGLSADVLAEIPSYVPGDLPTVPGHEAVCRIVAVGSGVKHHKVGERVLVQTDYRSLRTAGSNAAFGYNFEGALQQYVLMDERVVMDPETGERFLIPVGEELSASAVALVEPWACVEDSYVSPERRGPLAGGRMLVVADAGARVEGLGEAFKRGVPATIHCACADAEQVEALERIGPRVVEAESVAALGDAAFDDIVYFGATRSTIEALSDRLAAHGIANVVLGGRRIGEPVSIGVGRVHYGGTRWVGTAGESADEGYEAIPESGELRAGERMLVVGAAGPMGTMHVIRALSSGVAGISVTGTDFDDARLAALSARAQPIADARGAALLLANAKAAPVEPGFTYVALMAPVAALVAEAIDSSAPGRLINVFAGIPAPTRAEVDLDRYIANRCYMFGTSGSVIRDMRIVLERLASGRLDTNASVDAVSGMAGAIDGIRAVENRTLAGKIVVYPALQDLGLTPLGDLPERFPTVAAKLAEGGWTKAAEDELLRVAR